MKNCFLVTANEFDGKISTAIANYRRLYGPGKYVNTCFGLFVFPDSLLERERQQAEDNDCDDDLPAQQLLDALVANDCEAKDYGNRATNTAFRESIMSLSAINASRIADRL
jgi:hypothetical protein